MELEAGENPNPEAEPALHSPSGFSTALAKLGGSMVVSQSPQCSPTKAQPGRSRGAGSDLHTLEGSAGDEVTAQKVGHLLWLLLLPCGLSFQAALLGCSVTA